MREIRRKEKTITDLNEIKDILIRTKYVTIALSRSNIPYLVTLSHGYDMDKNCIYFHCASEGKKIDYLDDNNLVWGQAIDDLGYLNGKCSHAFKTAQFKGKITFIKDYNEKKKALTIMINQLEDNPEEILKKQLSRESAINDVTIGRIDIEGLSGKVNLD
jgi:nitroimidazol reductase NimA-like FMN-containing flavoprotein (pyridoxamine 5'-phosphate oxidase superfamily)